ncbi:MAG TPA: FtsX-like permease family protein [Ktedonosporobacter sp.]|jgi:putative ABC transport system permease protein|nr:FtsX-like permease family protein [Ktedonosporobacter sp.]
MSALLKKAVKDVTRRKLRAMLTILGIALGVMGLTALNTASAQVRASFNYTNDTAALPDIQFITASTQTPLAQQLRQQPNVDLVLAQGNLTTRWTFAGGHFPLNLVGISNFQSVPINTFQVIEGRVPQPGAREVVLESSAKAVSAVQVGDKISLNVHGEVQQFTVVGFVRTRGLAAATIMGNARGYMNETDLENFFQLVGANTFLVRVHNPAIEHDTALQLAAVIEGEHVEIYHTDVGQGTYSNATKTDTLFSIINIISLVALLLSALLLISTITALISEQVPIIGTMKAIGASRSQVITNYLTSVAIYAIFGTITGLALGLLLGYALTKFIGDVLNLDIGALSVEPATMIISVVVGLGVPLLAALAPVYLGTRITVRQALAGYGVEASAGNPRGLARLFGRAFAFLPQTVHFAFRSLFRKRTRLILTMAGLTAAGAVFLAVLTAVSSLSASTDQLLQTYNVNIEAVLPQPLPYQQIEQEIAHLQGVRLVEHMLMIPVSVGGTDAQLTGLEPGTRTYVSHLQAGRWLNAQDQQSVVINSHMADKLGLHVGDMITVQDNLHKGQFRVVGITLDNNGVTPTNLGVILTSLGQANAFAHTSAGASNTFLIQTESKAPAAIDATAVRIEDRLESLNLLIRTQTAQQLVAAFQSELQGVTALLAIATAIVALVGAMSLFNALAMSVLERQREIGILRSMGATARIIMQVFLTEGLAMGLLSWIAALVIGFFVAYGFVKVLEALLAPLPFVFNPVYLIWMLVFVLGVASLASVGPALVAGRIKIAQTLRYE